MAEKTIQQLASRLYYLENKDNLNQKRKLYKRQAWGERADNPKRLTN